jgi:hypothetical protein
MRAIVVMFLLITQAYAGEKSPNLDLETARRAVAATGMNPGLIFPVGNYRYFVSEVNSKQVKPNIFNVTIKIVPLVVHGQ